MEKEMYEFEDSQEETEKHADRGDSDSSYEGGKKKKGAKPQPKKAASTKKATPRLAPSSSKKSTPATTTAKRRKTNGTVLKGADESDSDVEHVPKPVPSTTTPEKKLLNDEGSEEPLFTQKKPRSPPLLASVVGSAIAPTTTTTTTTSSSSSSPSSSSSSNTSHNGSSNELRDRLVESHRLPETSSHTLRTPRAAPSSEKRESRREPSREPREDSRFSSKPSRLGKARPLPLAPTPTGRSVVRDMLDELVKRCALFGDVGSGSMEPERGRKRGAEDGKDEDFPPELFSPKTCRNVDDVLRVLDGRLLLLARLVSHYIFLYPSVLDSYNSLSLPQKLRLISKGYTRQRTTDLADSETEVGEDTLRIRAIMDELCEKYLLVGGPYSCSELEALFEDCHTVKDALHLNPWADLLPNIRLHALLNPHIAKPFRNMSMQEKMAYFDPF